MRAVIQRVLNAKVKVDEEVVGRIGHGLLILLAVHRDDPDAAVGKMADKIANLRIFSDSDGKMNLSVKEAGGEILLVSQFTLYGDCRKGNRPSFIGSARPEKAIQMYECLASLLREQAIKTETGRFGAKMKVELCNDGPVTVIVDL